MTPHPYASLEYASAFGPAFEPVLLKSSQCQVLKRLIPGTRHYDAMGCYPLSPLSDQANLEEDFKYLSELGIVSLVLVTDPFFHPAPNALGRHFDQVLPYKEHCLHDFSRNQTYSKHHRYEVRRAWKALSVQRIHLADYLRQWTDLYRELVEKHNIQGLQKFSEGYFSTFCALKPIMFGAFQDGHLVSAHLWLEHLGYVYSHLAASSAAGYQHRAAYAVMDSSLRYFAGTGAKIADLGSGAGVTAAANSLTFFKQGFSNASRSCYLSCKILDKAVYEALSAGKTTSYFPAYRAC